MSLVARDESGEKSVASVGKWRRKGRNRSAPNREQSSDEREAGTQIRGKTGKSVIELKRSWHYC